LKRVQLSLVFDGMRLGGGRQNDQSVFSLPPGLTVSIMRTSPKNKIVVIVDSGESGPRNAPLAFLKE